MTPIFYLYKLKKIEDFLFDKKLSERIKDYEELKHRKGVYEMLKWAEKNPSFHFESIMENAPVRGKLKFTNEEVYSYLMSFKSFMENEEFGLLTDDRPTNKPWEND
ncbi:conserved hypothetical protein [Tenacibaculum sp. 190524A02b]